MQLAAIKIGELAKKTGISVRTLHYYDEIGLLSPSHRTEAEHRLYTAEDMARLQQIMSLRQLGFSLAEIRECLDTPAFSLHHVIQLHRTRLHEQIALAHKLLYRLEAIAKHLQTTPSVSIEDLIQTIEVTSMYEKYYTTEQLETLKQRGQMIGEERIRQVEAEWQTLIQQARTEMERGTDPTSESVQILARRWTELLQEFTGGDSGIEHSLQQMYQQEGPVAASHGLMDSAVLAYMGEAMAALKR